MNPSIHSNKMESLRNIDTSAHEMLSEYLQCQQKFRKACSQVILLNNQIQNAQIRYDRAVKDGNKAFRYMGRLKLATLEGVRNTIYEYAARLGDEIDAQQERLVDMGLMEEEYSPMDV